MVSGDAFKLPLRWQFSPLKRDSDGAVQWTWAAYTHGGEIALEAGRTFETLSECMADARSSGYVDR